MLDVISVTEKLAASRVLQWPEQATETGEQLLRE